MSISWKIIGKNDTVLANHEYTACYQQLSSGGEPELLKKATKIVIYENLNSYNITEQQVERFVRDISRMGFTCRFKGLQDVPVKTYDYNTSNYIDNKRTTYIIEVPIRDNKKLYYTKKDHLLSTLTILRYMFEEPYSNNIPQTYFKICDAVGKKVNKFFALQIAERWYSGGGGHCLFYNEDGKYFNKLLTKKKVFESFKNDEKSLYSTERSNIFSHFASPILFRSKSSETNYKKIYNMVVKEKVEPTCVFVVGHATNYANWLPNCKLVNTVEEADVVLFTGGEDVDPSLYGEPKGEHTGSNLQRDEREKEIFLKAQKLGKKFLGICRGSQFLCVMAGGKLIQHQDNPLHTHEVNIKDGRVINITSTHHQAAHPWNLQRFHFDVIGWTNNISKFHLDGNGKELSLFKPSVYSWDDTRPKECEIVYYRNINALGIQGHPEMGTYQADPKNAESLEYLKELFTQLINDKL